MTANVVLQAPILLANALASSLSQNARAHLRAGQITRHPNHAMSAEGLRARLLLGGLPAHEAVCELEARAGGTAFPEGWMLGTGALLLASPWLRLRELPRLNDEPLLPVFGRPELLTESWDAPVFVMGGSGAVAYFESPAAPLPLCDSPEQLLEVLALAPLSPSLHRLRIDGRCGEEVAGLVGALPHPEAQGVFAKGFVGSDVWVLELAPGGDAVPAWSRFCGTFLLTEQLSLLAEVAELMLAEGYGLGHEGPTREPPSDADTLLSFVDLHPGVGAHAHRDVSVFAVGGQLGVWHRTHLGEP